MAKKILTPGTVWITGLCNSGKTTLGERLSAALVSQGYENVTFIDSGELRKTVNKGLGFSIPDRYQSFLNVVNLCKQYNAQGRFTIVSQISHKRDMREEARASIAHFMEIFLDCPPQICAQRDQKGLYEKALENSAECFPGVTEAYECHTAFHPELTLDTHTLGVSECLDRILDAVRVFNREEAPVSKAGA